MNLSFRAYLTFERPIFGDVDIANVLALKFIKLATTLMALVIVLGIEGCGRSTPVPEYDMVDPAPVGWRMSPDEVVVAATRYCEDAGMTDHIRQGPPSIVVHVYEGERYWSLGYHQNSRYHGDHFMLTLNDSTEQIEFLGGE